MSPVAVPNGSLYNLNTLRALAVTAVLAQHLTTMLATRGVIYAIPGLFGIGHMGVIAFFVHTSLVLMFSLERLAPERRAISFYIRRIFRIYPLAVLCTTLVLTFKIPVAPEMGDVFHWPSTVVIFSNLFLIQNIIGHTSVSAPMWSLPFEIQMYIGLPFLLTFVTRLKSPGLLAGLIGGFSLLGWIVKHQTGHANMLAYIPCFLGGVLAYALRQRIRPFLPSLGWPFFLLSWITAASLSLQVPAEAYEPVTWAAAIVLGISIFCFQDSTNRAWNTATELIAKYSYGIYLSHLPVLWLAFSVLRVPNALMSVLLWLAGTAGVSVAVFHLIEDPMIKLGRQLTRPTTTQPVVPDAPGLEPIVTSSAV